MSPRVRRVLVIAGAAIGALLIVTQIFLPSYVSGRIEDRLTEDGGQAKASVSAVPALRLLATDGSKVSIDARGLKLKPELGDNKPLDKLDGFHRVDVRIADSTAGPVTVSSFDLKRDGGDPYALTMKADVTLADLTRYAASQVDSRLGFLLGTLAQGSVPNADQELNVDANMGIKSDGGSVKVVSGDATVEGIPVTPLVQLLIQAVSVKV